MIDQGPQAEVFSSPEQQVGDEVVAERVRQLDGAVGDVVRLDGMLQSATTNLVADSQEPPVQQPTVTPINDMDKVLDLRRRIQGISAPEIRHDLLSGELDEAA